MAWMHLIFGHTKVTDFKFYGNTLEQCSINYALGILNLQWTTFRAFLFFILIKVNVTLLINYYSLLIHVHL